MMKSTEAVFEYYMIQLKRDGEAVFVLQLKQEGKAVFVLQLKRDGEAFSSTFYIPPLKISFGGKKGLLCLLSSYITTEYMKTT